MTSTNFASGLGSAAPGLASRRGGQNIKPLSFDAIKGANETKDNGVPTPRTSRSHLLAGLRTAPKTAVGTTFASSHSTVSQPQQQYARSVNASYNGVQDKYNAPKTALPRFNNQGYGVVQPQFTADQILAPPEIQIDDQSAESMDPNTYAQLMATNMYLAQQQQQLQQQLRDVQAAAQQLQGLSFQQRQQQQQYMYAQSQAAMMGAPMSAQPRYYAYVDPATGQQTLVVDQSAGQYSPFVEQAHGLTQQQLVQLAALQQQQQQLQMQMQMQRQAAGTPRVQVSPPPAERANTPVRSNSPPKRYESPADVTPLPPPSANAFRRGHKKASSVTNANGLSVNVESSNKGPKSAAFPLTPMTGGFMPGQGRAGEHPIRQPRGPPSFDELASKPTAKHEGSKNFAARTRRSAVHNLVRAHKERRKGTGSSTGSMSPLSESAEESETPITDNDSDSGRSGSGSLSGDIECSLPSSRTSTRGSWGAIGSDRPSSRQNTRDSVGSSATSVSESDASFAACFKNGSQTSVQTPEEQRKAPRMILTKNAPAVWA